MIRTRVGYSGGKFPNPTYRDLGDNTESIQIDYDPTRVTYQQLVAQALKQGDFSGESWSKQYRSAVFYHSQYQQKVAQSMGITKLEPAGRFTRAEDYHQKYYLQQSEVYKDFLARYPNAKAFTDSTAVARANGIVGGHFDEKHLTAILPKLGVSRSSTQAMMKMAGTSQPGCAMP